jgi:hypothetical protein
MAILLIIIPIEVKLDQKKLLATMVEIVSCK